jgi:hypothetical protein
MPVGEPCEVGPVGGVRLLGARGAGGLGIRGGIGDQARQRRRDLREGGGKPLTFDNRILAQVRPMCSGYGSSCAMNAHVALADAR